jgi:hypothetical protein
MRQAEDLQIGPPDPARQGDALLEVPVRVFVPNRPGLGDAQADHRQCGYVVAKLVLDCVPGVHRGEQQLAKSDVKPGTTSPAIGSLFGRLFLAGRRVG